MQTSLSNLVDNLSGIYDKECKKYKERRKIKLSCNLLDLKVVDWIISVNNVKDRAQKF